MKKNEHRENGHNTEQDNLTFNINTDENMSGDQHLNEPVTDETEIEALKEEIAQLNDKVLRQAAEFDNFKRRNAKERVELIQTAGRDVITDLLEVLDDYERAEKQLESSDDVSQIKEGIKLVFNKLKNTLFSKGLKSMDAMNKEFNPDMHEAITEIDGGEEMKGKVVAEVQKGYYLNDKIIRFAKVVVGK
jgi:molecular chaperone GrpE